MFALFEVHKDIEIKPNGQWMMILMVIDDTIDTFIRPRKLNLHLKLLKPLLVTGKHNIYIIF